MKGRLQKLHVDACVREPDGPRIRAALFADGFHQILMIHESTLFHLSLPLWDSHSSPL